MIKDRKEGLIFLQGCALGIAAAAVFLGWAWLVERTGWIHLLRSVNVPLYLLGIGAASLLVLHGLRGVGNLLAEMGWLEAIRHARQQIFCFAAVLFTLAFVTKDSDVSRAFVMSYLVLMLFVFVVANVYLPKLIVRVFFRNAVMRTVVVATPEEAAQLGRWMDSHRYLGIQIVGRVSADETEDNMERRGQPPRLGRLGELRRVVLEHDVAQIVISQSAYRAEEGRAITQCAEEMGCRVRFFTNAQSYFGERPVGIEHEGEFTFVTLMREPLDNPVNRLLKRTLDVAVALPVIMFILPPLTLMVWISQRRQSPGPVFHRQYRSGLNRRKFLIYKFRTMHVAGEAGALARQAQRGDSRVFPFGRFLRRSSLDEFPQFLNVLSGDMSVSGPRPHLLEHDEQFAKIVNTYYARHFVKPGITGLAQSKGLRGEISEPGLLHSRIGYDMMYIRRWTLALDLHILVETARQLLFPPRSAY